MTRANSKLDGMATLRRSHTCGALTPEHVGTEVIVAGWAHRRRDHGGVIFVDLRDSSGVVQVVFRPEESAESHERAGEIRSEYVILVRGKVARRSEETINPKMQTGEIEVVVSEIRLLNRATPPPMAIEDDPGVDSPPSVDIRTRPFSPTATTRSAPVATEKNACLRSVS